MAEPVVAVEFDLIDRGRDPGNVTVRLCNRGPLTASIAGERVLYLPFLIVPLLLGGSLSVEQPGQSARGQANGGQIRFGLHDRTLPWLGYVWEGFVFRVYSGEFAAGYDGLSLAYVGRVDRLACDFIAAIVTVTTTDARVDLDRPVVSDLYDNSALEALRGRPKPQLFGRGFSLAPTLEDQAAYRYRVSRAPLAGVTALRIGGVPWDVVGGAPAQGQWMPDPANGTLALGGTPLDGETRVDAQALGWDSYSAASLLTEIVAGAGGTVDGPAMTALTAAAPYLVGYYATDAVNRQDILDELMAGIGGWWTANSVGSITAGIIEAPAATPIAAYDDVHIASCQLTEIVRPVWRLRIEYRRNWQPAGQFFSSVTAADQAAMRAGGIVAAAWGAAAVPSYWPRAVDAPLIRSLVNTEDDALVIRDRLGAAWGVERRLYDISVRADPPALYSTVRLDYRGVSGNFRVVSALRSIGGGASTLRLWG